MVTNLFLLYLVLYSMIKHIIKLFFDELFHKKINFFKIFKQIIKFESLYLVGDKDGDF